MQLNLEGEFKCPIKAFAYCLNTVCFFFLVIIGNHRYLTYIYIYKNRNDRIKR